MTFGSVLPHDLSDRVRSPRRRCVDGAPGGSDGGQALRCQGWGTDSGSLAIFSRSGWESGALGFGDGIFTTPEVNLSIYQGLGETH